YGRLQPLLSLPLPMSAEARFASYHPSHIVGLRQPETVPDATDETPGPVAASIHHVTFCYPGAQTPALQDVSLEIPAGSLVAVTGPIGSGKSALARILLGLYPLASGCVEFDRPNPRIGYLSQE